MWGARQALQLVTELLPDQTRVLGADHPEVLNTRSWIHRLSNGDPP